MGEINDMSGRSESKWKAAHELKKQLKAAEEKLAKAKGAESTGTLLIEGGAHVSASNFLASTENNVQGSRERSTTRKRRSTTSRERSTTTARTRGGRVPQ